MSLKKTIKLAVFILMSSSITACVTSPVRTSTSSQSNYPYNSNNTAQNYPPQQQPVYQNNTPTYKNAQTAKPKYKKQPKVIAGNLTKQEKNALLNYHNRARKQVKVRALKWSPHLAKTAFNWAKKLKANQCRLAHSNSKFGENLFMGTLGYYKPVDAAKSWESEKKYYKRQPLNTWIVQNAGHYTQMVWKNTTQLGCAKIACNNQLLVVCNYNPAGNYLGQKAY